MGTYKDVGFYQVEIQFMAESERLREFLKYLRNSTLMKQRKILMSYIELENSETKDLLIDCLKQAQKLFSLLLQNARFSSE